MTEYGTWSPYLGTDAVFFAVTLLAIGVLLTYLGTRLTGVVKIKRPVGKTVCLHDNYLGSFFGNVSYCLHNLWPTIMPTEYARRSTHKSERALRSQPAARMNQTKI